MRRVRPAVPDQRHVPRARLTASFTARLPRSEVELVGHWLYKRQRRQAGLRAQLVERDHRVIVEHQVTAHVVLEVPRQRRLALLGVTGEILELAARPARAPVGPRSAGSGLALRGRVDRAPQSAT